MSRKDLTPAELRALIKGELGYNQRQVTVVTRSSNSYLTITIRDPKVDVAKVKAFAQKHHTWTMDQTDYCDGQSIDVQTTKEVDAAHAEPFIPLIRAALARLAPCKSERDSTEIVPHVHLIMDERDAWIWSQIHDKDGVRQWASDLREGKPHAITSLALSYKQVTGA